MNKPDYIMVGDGTVNKDGLQSIDLLREMAKASKAEQYLLLAIINGVSYKMVTIQ